MTRSQVSMDGPDRGWSWVIAFAAFFNSLILAGIFRTSGVLFVAFIKEFGVTREEASWPVVLCISVLNLVGIVSGPLGQRFGIRPVCMVGALVATAGMSACFFTTSLGVITVLFGVVFGMGYGLISTLMPVAVNTYFLKYRATANGIANSGSCFGSLILPPLFEYFIFNYELSGCFLLTGAFVLHTAIAGALMRPPSWQQKKNGKTKNENLIRPKDCEEVRKNAQRRNSNYKTVEERNNEACSSKESELRRDTTFQSELKSALNRRSMQLNINKYEVNSKNRPASQNFEPNGVKSLNNDIYRSIEELEKSFEVFQEVYSTLSRKRTPSNTESTTKIKDISDTKETYTKMALDSSDGWTAAEGKGEKIKEEFETHCNRNSVTSSKILPAQNGVIDNCKLNNDHVALSISEKSQTTESNTFDSFRRVLRTPAFYVITIINVSFYFLYHMFVVIIVDFALDKGIASSDTKFVLFGFAGADLVGRLCLGWITDRRFLQRSHFVMGCMAMIGFVFISFPFAQGLVYLIVFSCLYGLLLGCTMVVFPILLVDALGIEIHGVSMGCMCFCNGLATLSRPSIIGYFRDSFGDYSNIFYILAAISLSSSILLFLESYVCRKLCKNNRCCR